MLGEPLKYSWCFEGLKAVHHWDVCFPSGSLVLEILFSPFCLLYVSRPFHFFLPSEVHAGITAKSPVGDSHGFPRFPAQSTPVAGDSAPFLFYPLLLSRALCYSRTNWYVSGGACILPPLCVYSQSPCSTGLTHTTTSPGALSDTLSTAPDMREFLLLLTLQF